MPANRLSAALAQLDPAIPVMRPTPWKSAGRCSGRGASDIHFQPGGDGLELRWRIDGVLQLGRALAAEGRAQHRRPPQGPRRALDLPHGRASGRPDQGSRRARSRCGVSTFPTLFGEKAVVRMFAGPGAFLRLVDLGLPESVHDQLEHLLGETSGAIVLSGPAGSGKTTTIYACLRELAARSRGERSLATLEDPIEAVVPGVAQSQVNPAAGLTLESGLKSLLRQDPEVIAIGEIRDKTTAEIALQAALTGHLILTTFHAGSACEVIGRFLDMGIEPYVVPKRPLRGRRPAPGPAPLRLCDSLDQARRFSRPARAPSAAAARLRRLRRNRLRGAHRACRAARPETDELARAVLAIPISASSSGPPSPAA